jgi:D-alanyl-lipoteichoic acid acyltransferase DltB (MBOAT superfamily)
MLFNSYEFVFGLLPFTLLVYLLCLRAGKHEAALTVVLFASIFFYGWWNPQYVVLILASMGFNFAVGLGLENPRIESARRRLLLAVGIAANLLLLGYFKYAAFAVMNVKWITGADYSVPTIVLPLAISFFTFQQIAYLVDAFRGETREYSFLHYALFVTFFPQLIAGPIVHHKEIMPEFQRVRREGVSRSEIATGACFFVIGLFKKVVIADNVAVYSTPVFAAADAGQALAAGTAWIGVLAYTLQLYFDFSGYADMAVGAARMFGVRLPYNFNSPYKALNISEFWRRWHMTLSRFLRDYLYIPLGGNRHGNVRRHVNLMITMLLGGLWHGAGWNFVIWGGLHGVALVVNHWWRNFRDATASTAALSAPSHLRQAMSWALTMLVVIAGWALFRATTLDGALGMLVGMVGMGGAEADTVLPRSDLSIAWVLIAAGLGIALFMPNSQQLLDGLPAGHPESLPVVPIRLSMSARSAAAFGVLFFVCLASMSQVSEFLYFQF